MGPNLLNTVKDLDRLRQIVGVLAKHGFGQLVARSGLGALVSKKRKEEEQKKTVGERLRLTLQELGPSFVKLGQIISTRPDPPTSSRSSRSSRTRCRRSPSRRSSR